jgi:hypothetical protein
MNFTKAGRRVSCASALWIVTLIGALDVMIGGAGVKAEAEAALFSIRCISAWFFLLASKTASTHLARIPAAVH